MISTPITNFAPWRTVALSLLALCVLVAASPAAAAAEDETTEDGSPEEATDSAELTEQSDEAAEDGDAPQCATYLPAELSERPQELVLQGVTCFEAGQYEWALIYYQRAYELTGERFLYGGMGRSLHELGLYGPAMSFYQQFLRGDDVPSGADRIRQRMEELEELIEEDGAIVALRSDPTGAQAYLLLDNGERFHLGITPMDIAIREGTHQVIFTHDGYHSRQVSFTAGDEEAHVDGRLISETSSLNISERRRRRGGLVLTGLGAGATAAGSTMIALSVHHDRRARNLEEGTFNSPSDYDERLRGHLDSGDQWRTMGAITFGAGAAVLITGTILYLSGQPTSVVEKPSPPDESLSRGWSPSIGPGQVGLELRF